MGVGSRGTLGRWYRLKPGNIPAEAEMFGREAHQEKESSCQGTTMPRNEKRDCDAEYQLCAAKESGEAGSIIACSCVFMCIEVYQGAWGDGRVRYIVCDGDFRNLAAFEFFARPDFLYV